MKPTTLVPQKFLKPHGYTGRRHEVLGEDILAHLKVLRSPEVYLGPEKADELREIYKDRYYPIEALLVVCEALETSRGKLGLVRAGRTLFELSHIQDIMAKASNAKEVLHLMDAVYRHSNKGIGIGAWKVLNFGIGRAELEKTTPQHCMVEEGVLTAALSSVHCPSTVTQEKCIRRGDDRCIFSVTSAFIDHRWSPV